MRKLTGIVLGAILVACGVIYILDAFEITEINISLDGWWTLFIIIPCLNGLFTSKGKSVSFIGLATGVLLLLASRNVFDYEMVWKIIVPLIIIVLGIKLIVKSTITSSKVKYNAKKGRSESMAAFTSRTFNYSDEEITVARIGAIFGGAECNLNGAKIKDGSQIDLFCAFGGADIFVPANVNVKNNAFCLFGGISDKREIKTVNPDNTTLTINGFCMFGGADIK